MFVLNISWNGRLIILRSILKHWPYFLSNITADRGQIEPHFQGFTYLQGYLIWQLDSHHLKAIYHWGNELVSSILVVIVFVYLG